MLSATRLILLAGAACLAACATAPTAPGGRALTLADAGPAPTDYRAVVTEALRYRLKDAESARIEYPTSPRPVVMAHSGLNVGGAGWEICPMVNAKNGFGAYTGWKPVYILWNAGQVIDFKMDDMSDFWCGDKNDAKLAAGPRLR